MFVTGIGVDAVTIVNPYQNEVDQTVLAGRMPGAMAVSPKQNLLLVANQGGGDLTIMDIDTRHVEASVHIGENPGAVFVTPDGEYAMVVDRISGSVRQSPAFPAFGKSGRTGGSFPDCRIGARRPGSNAGDVAAFARTGV